METTTEAIQNNRELTPTEIKIAIAQIEDRLSRWIAASAAIRDSWEEYETDDMIKRAEEECRAKYQIPYGVALMPEEAMDDRDKPLFLRFAKWWVKGEMDDESFDMFVYHFSEIVEVDFFWVLMDQPAFYYACLWPDLSEAPDLCKLDAELKQIGTRSRKKQKVNFTFNIGHFDGFHKL